MKVTFFSNFLNHHQTPFCDEMYKQLDGNFTFVSTEKIPESFLNSGYPDCTSYPYNLNAFTDDICWDKAMQLGIDSDIVIIGSASKIFIKERLKQNKITFSYLERLLKKGLWQILDINVLFSLLKHHTQNRNKRLYVLCASAYTANDLSWVFAYPQKKYKWGYFTEIEDYNIKELIIEKPIERIEIIWTARFLIKLKHPELVIKLAYELKKRGYNFHINLIGAGGMYKYIQKLITKLDICENISLLGNLPNNQVRRYMLKSNIFLFTSDRNEGWGAVLNEAMSSGCAVVASNAIGSVPFLIDHNINGLIFNSGSLSSLLKQTEILFTNKTLREKLSINAYTKMKNEWSPKTATLNFLALAKSMLTEQQILIEHGPCSKAK